MTPCFIFLSRKRDIAASVQQCREEDHQVRAGRLHIVPPASRLTHQPPNPHSFPPPHSTHTWQYAVIYPSIDTKQAQPQ